MTINQLQFKRDDDSFISLNEIEERCIKYVRNIVIGFNRQVKMDVEKLKIWLARDVRLTEFPSDEVLESWLKKWDFNYLAEWSFENDHINQTKLN